MGIAGACRREELVKMTLDHISDKDSMLVVDVGDTKNYVDRTFVVSGGKENLHLYLYRKYLAIRPAHTPHNRLFIFYKKGHCKIQPIGIHSLVANSFT
jgi:integrase